jgi:hypothetical protein
MHLFDHRSHRRFGPRAIVAPQVDLDGRAHDGFASLEPTWRRPHVITRTSDDGRPVNDGFVGKAHEVSKKGPSDNRIWGEMRRQAQRPHIGLKRRDHPHCALQKGAEC